MHEKFYSKGHFTNGLFLAASLLLHSFPVQRIIIPSDKDGTLAELQLKEVNDSRYTTEILSYFYWRRKNMEKEAKVKGTLHFCCLEVGHLQSLAFVLCDNPINHGMSSVNAQWLCSAGGLSHWMPGLLPLCSASKPFFFSPFLFIPWYSEMAFLACPLCTSDTHLFDFLCPWKFY